MGCVLFQTELYKEMIEVTQPVFMKIFDEAIQTNGGNYLVGDSVSVIASHPEKK